MKFNAANAREMAARSAAARQANKERAKHAAEIQAAADRPHPPQSEDEIAEAERAFVTGLRIAQAEKLAALLIASDPRDVAALARGLREIRETLHLATGQARPGVRKDEPGRRPGPTLGGPLEAA